MICPHCGAEYLTEKTEEQKNEIPHSYAWCLKCKGAMLITYNKMQDDMTVNKRSLRDGE